MIKHAPIRPFTLHLHGFLKDKFGGPYTFHVSSPAAALRLMEANFKGKFYEALSDGDYYVFRGSSLEDGKGLVPQTLLMGVGGDDVHVMPAIRGAGVSKGGILAIVGTVLIAAAVVAASMTAGASMATLPGLLAALQAPSAIGVSYGTIATLGLSLAVGGLLNVLSQVSANPVTWPGGLFGSPTNTAQAGVCVPVVYGRVRCGTVLVSAGIHIYGQNFNSTGISGGQVQN